MTLTLLLDLDDTLLNNGMDAFLPAYMGSLGQHMADFAAPEEVTKQLIAGVQAMVMADRPGPALKERFDAVFYPGTGMDYEAAQEPLQDYYQNVYPQVRSVTSPIPEAAANSSKRHSNAATTSPSLPTLCFLELLHCNA